ncbi:MAG: hypothetical protein QXM06_04305 [Archaeoglobaceae archaeon]
MIEGRCCLLSTILLTISVYISVNPIVSAYVILVSALATRGFSFKVLKLFLPLIMVFSISALLLQNLNLILKFVAILSCGSLVFATQQSQIAGALKFLRIPEKFISVTMLALNFFKLITWDLENMKTLNLPKRDLLKTLASMSVLRAIGMAESLYSKCYNYRAFYEVRKVSKRDTLLIAASILALILR